ncbi:MAG: rhomboid family intramembrane serine protease [Chlorobi bacterium]|nr:rhomboid family intramembrane serine protease [Chlorobiota bacterium]
MQQSGIWNSIKQSFREGSSLIQLIYINTGVFLVINLLYIILFLFSVSHGSSVVLPWLAVPAYLPELIRHPWTPITYMFTHQSFFHILFNLLWLYWFGKIFLEYFDQKKLIAVYILGGLSGAALYIFSYNLFPALQPLLRQSLAIGASAAIMAVVVAISVYVPDYTIYLLLIGPVKIKYVALTAFILTSLLDFSSNTGGKIAHIGGALYGYLYVLRYRQGKDMSRSFNRLLDTMASWFKPRKTKMKITYKRPLTDLEYNKKKVENQAEINRILDKISKGGYESLSKAEKETLFRASNKN